jgi:hypothetical protein
MRISVRSSICQAASPRPLAFQGLRDRTQTGPKLEPALPRRQPHRRASRLLGSRFAWSLDVEKR